MSHYGWIIRIADFLMFIWVFITLTVGYGAKRSVKNCMLQGLFYACLGSGCILLQEAFCPSYSIYQMLFLLFGVLYCLTALGGQTGPKITTAALYCASFYLCFDLSFWLLPPGSFVENRLSCQLIHLLLTLLISRCPLKSRRRIPRLYWLPMLLICLLIACWVLLPWNREETQDLTGKTSLFMLTIMYICYILHSKLIRDYERTLVQVSMKEDSGESVLEQENARLQEMLRHEQHERRNHAATLAALIEQSRAQEALSLLSAWQTGGEAASPISGNAIVNAVLARYTALAERQGIAFSREVCLDAALPLDNAELSSLLNNLLSNAFEASARVSEPQVEIRVFPAKDYLCIFVRNRADRRSMMANPLLHTTKKNPELHGIGLQVVREIAERRHGWVEISAKDSFFTVQVMLLLPSA